MRSVRRLALLAVLLCALLCSGIAAPTKAANSAASSAKAAAAPAAAAAALPTAAEGTEPADPTSAQDPAALTDPDSAAAAGGAVPTAATKEESIAEVVAALGKADDKDTELAFEKVDAKPVGGTRLVKDILTGKLKPVPTAEELQAAAADAAAATSTTTTSSSAAQGAKGAGKGKGKGKPGAAGAAAGAAGAEPVVGSKISAVVAAALAGARARGAAAAKAHTDRQKKSVLVSGGAAGAGGAKEFHSKEAKPMHLHVGSQMGTPDIVADGALTTSWNISETSAEEDVQLSTVPAELDYSDFYLWRSFAEGDRPRRVITAQKPFVLVNNSEVVEAKVALWGPKHMTPIPLSNGTESEAVITDAKTNKKQKIHEMLFGLQYECHAEGSSLVTVVLRVFELTTGQRASESLQWSFIKRCRAPSQSQNETNAEGNAAIPGLGIGTRNNQTDVVRHGEALEEWTLGTEAVPKATHTYGPEVEGAKWWMTYEPSVVDANLTVNKAMFDVDDPTVLLIEDSGDLTEQSTLLKSGRTFTLSVSFTCKKEGTVTATVVFNFPDQNKVSFSFLKQCAGLQVADGATMNGIDIWQDQNEESRKPEVVENGVVQPEWRPIQNLTSEPDVVRTAGADANLAYVSFFVKLRKGYHPVEYDAPIVESYSASGDVILRPLLSGSIHESSKLVMNQPRFIVLAFNCIKEGDAVVTIKLPFRPSGSIQWNMRKTCVVQTEEQISEAEAVAEYSTGDVLTELPGINVGHSLDQANVVRNGFPLDAYHLEENIDTLQVVGTKAQWVNFFLWKNTSYPNATDVRFGRPELIFTADIARPVISGLGAEGGLIADNEYSALSVTFHCFTAGNTTITLSIPLVADEWLNTANEPVSIQPVRSDPIKISFVKECPQSQDEPVSGMGGIGISGFSVGLQPNTTELVFNGFPRPKYFGQRRKPKPDWNDIIVDAKFESTTLYIHYNSKSGDNRLVGSEVMFQAPVIMAHNPTARPALAGQAAAGGVLLRDGPALALDVTYNCRYAGLSVSTLILPIVPHGQISIDLPKWCVGGQPPHGLKVSGLHVGTTPEGSEVVADGQTTKNYVSYATKKYQEHKVFGNEETTTFYIRKTGDPIRALEPLIYAQKPIVNVRVTHALLLNSSQVDDDADGDEIELNEQVATINITYACVHPGKTDITISLNLLPKGQVQWTWEKHCEEYDAEEVTGPLRDAGILPGGEAGEGSEYNLESEYDKYKRLAQDDEYNYHYGTAEGKVSSASMWASAYDKAKPIPAMASITPASDEFSYSTYDADYNPHASFDHTEAESRERIRAPGIATFQIGTSKSGDAMHDVFHRSLPAPRYQMKTKPALDITQYAVIKPDQDVSTFYLSTTAKSQRFGKPSVVLDKSFAAFLTPVLSGSAAAGGELVSDAQPAKLEVQYQCKKGGVFAVGIRVPVGEQLALFRVIKICPNHQVHEAFYWTAGRVMSLIGLVAAIVALAAGFFFMRRVFEKKKTLANAMYVPVQTEPQS